ncbi:MAG: hypothetical protein HYW49_11995 [Deltaproteobacteria bacterium]|nr:hypothetical protein [Deltaproteobacteria bacterium]
MIRASSRSILKPNIFRALHAVSALVILATSTGCGLIFGGSQKVDNKSSHYSVYRLDREEGGHWRLIEAGARPAEDAKSASSSDQEPEQADVAFEHKMSGAIASLNSVCRPQGNATIEELSRGLFMGLPDRKTLDQRRITLDDVPALDATVESGDIRVRAVVLKKTGCTYDLMYIAKAAVFNRSLPDFDRFLKGFHAE